jgi:hypothetical protein
VVELHRNRTMHDYDLDIVALTKFEPLRGEGPRD